MDITTALTGVLPAVIVISAVITAVVSVLCLALYKRKVLYHMNVSSEGASTFEYTRHPSEQLGSPELEIVTLACNGPVSDHAKTAFRTISMSLRRQALVYAIAGLAYAVVMSFPWMVSAEGGFPALRFLWLVSCYAWPSVLAILITATTTGRGRVAVIGIYIVLMAGVGATVLVRNPGQDLG